MARSELPPGGDRRAALNPLKLLIQAWPIVAVLVSSLVAGMMQWADIRRDLGVIERRLTETDRRVIALEAADVAHAAAMTEVKVALAEIKATLALIRAEIETPPRPRRRAEAPSGGNP